MDKFVMNVKECSEYLDIGENKIRELCDAGEIKAARCGKNWKIPRPCAEEFILKKAALGQQI